MNNEYENPLLGITNDAEAVNCPDLCLICTRDGKPMYKLKCNHVFCKSCIRRWLTENPTCPVCRQDATITDMTALKKEDDTCRNRCGNIYYGYIKKNLSMLCCKIAVSVVVIFFIAFICILFVNF